MKRFVVLGCLASCSSPPAPAAAPGPPPSLTTCPSSVAVPAPLPGIVTTERLKVGYAEMEAARIAERRRGDACALKLRQLSDWIGR